MEVCVGRIKMKVLKTCLLLLTCFSLNLEAAPLGLLDIKLLSDSSFNSHFFGAEFIVDKMQLFQKIKPYGKPNWDPADYLSDPDVGVASYEVTKDSDDNFMIAWMGENTSLGIYSLYIRLYVASKGKWSPIMMVSDITDNLVGGYSISINTVEAEIIWNSYDGKFNIEEHSAIFSLNP
jgi:hypothetical protein